MDCTFQSCGLYSFSYFSYPLSDFSHYLQTITKTSATTLSQNIENNNNQKHTIVSYIFQHPNALFLEFLLLLFPSHGTQKSPIKPSSTTSWSAGLTTLAEADLVIKQSLRGQNCVCITRVKPCRCLSAGRTACFGEYFQMAESHTYALSALEYQD